MNLKDELLNHIGNRRVFCADIYIIREESKMGVPRLTQFQVPLPIDFTQNEWDEFLRILDENSPDFHSKNRVWGTLWYDNVTWSTKGIEFNDEWKYHRHPPVPKYLYEK